MTSQEQAHPTDYRMITIKTSDGSTVRGRVNITPHQRVSELFTIQKGPFVVMIDASYGGVSGKTFFINKQHIVWVEPEDHPPAE